MDAKLWLVITEKEKVRWRQVGTAEKFTSPQRKWGVQTGRTRAKDKERSTERRVLRGKHVSALASSSVQLLLLPHGEWRAGDGGATPLGECC